MPRTLLPGKPYPLGATPTSEGTNFALYSENASAVHVCFFDEKGKQTDCVHLRERTAFVWHGLIRNIKPGQRYGFRVEGHGSPKKVCASMQPSCSSTLTRRRSAARSIGRSPSFPTM